MLIHYSEQAVRERAVDVGEGYFMAGLVLHRGDTAWNPASTKGPLYGPSLVEYELHFTGIRIYENVLKGTCVVGDRNPDDVWVPCSRPRRAPDDTRCGEHTLAAYADQT
jgi:hypothetical protein